MRTHHYGLVQLYLPSLFHSQLIAPVAISGVNHLDEVGKGEKERMICLEEVASGAAAELHQQVEGSGRCAQGVHGAISTQPRDRGGSSAPSLPRRPTHGAFPCQEEEAAAATADQPSGWTRANWIRDAGAPGQLRGRGQVLPAAGDNRGSR